jgi:uncharacterized damage-inducible protein DinB
MTVLPTRSSDPWRSSSARRRGGRPRRHVEAADAIEVIDRSLTDVVARQFPEMWEDLNDEGRNMFVRDLMEAAARPLDDRIQAIAEVVDSWQGAWSLLYAPVDGEPYTAEERAQDDAALVRFRHGDGVRRGMSRTCTVVLASPLRQGPIGTCLSAVSAFEDILARYAGLPDQTLSGPWRWPGHSGGPLEVRDALLRSLEMEQAALARAGAGAGEVAWAVAQAQAAYGDLRGLLCGRPDDLLDAKPAGGEWTLRKVLQHVLWVDRRYRFQTAYAAGRADEDPVRRDPDIPLEDAATMTAWLQRLATAREECRGLLTITQRQLSRPTTWTAHAVDVRFRLHRFTGHLAQHTVQCETILGRLGHLDSEARRLVRRISTARGGHELQSEHAVLLDLDEQHRALANSISVPAG